VDSRRFDRIARRLAGTATRRTAVGAAVALVVGAPLADSVAAVPRVCRAERKTCTKDAQCCTGTCRIGRQVPLRDRNRCGCDGLVVCGECIAAPVSEHEMQAIQAMIC